MNSTQFWETICIQAFNNDADSSNFILFFEGCKNLTQDEQAYFWKTHEYQDGFEKLGCLLQDNNAFLLSLSDYATLSLIKSQARTQWHSNRQIELKQHLDRALNAISPLPLDITVEQRLALVREFMLNHETDVGSIPFVRGVVGFLKYQLQQRQFLVDWEMSEYVLTQNNEDAIDSYIRLLRGVLGLQLVYKDQETKDETVIHMQPPVLVWRMNYDIDNSFIYQCLACLNKNPQTTTPFTDYKVTDIPRKQKNLIDWIYEILNQLSTLLNMK